MDKSNHKCIINTAIVHITYQFWFHGDFKGKTPMQSWIALKNDGAVKTGEQVNLLACPSGYSCLLQEEGWSPGAIESRRRMCWAGERDKAGCAVGRGPHAASKRWETSASPAPPHWLHGQHTNNKESQPPVAQCTHWAWDLGAAFLLSNEDRKPTIATGVLLKSLKTCGLGLQHSQWADPKSHAWSPKSEERWSIRLNVYPDPIRDMNHGSASAESEAAESVRPLTMS